MIERIIPEYDSYFPDKLNQISSYQTKIHQHEIRCSVCGQSYFVDDKKFEELERLMKYDLDNQFLCEDCEREYQDEAFE